MCSHGWDLMLVCRLSCGPAEECCLEKLEELVIEAAQIDISEEVSSQAPACACLGSRLRCIHSVGVIASMAACLI